jgi:hypothetical protein
MFNAIKPMVTYLEGIIKIYGQHSALAKVWTAIFIWAKGLVHIKISVHILALANASPVNSICDHQISN